MAAHDSPQFLQDQITASDVFAAQRAALEFADQQRALPAKLTQKFPQSLDGRFGARHPQSVRSKPFGLIRRRPLRRC